VQLHLDVRDDGPGFDLSAAHDGVGLQNMRDRLGAVRGSVEIVSQPGRGTLVAATAPVRRDS
jgi:signal transduction histidine kinase